MSPLGQQIRGIGRKMYSACNLKVIRKTGNTASKNKGGMNLQTINSTLQIQTFEGLWFKILEKGHITSW